MIYAIAIFAPLGGALISGLLGKAIGDRAAMGASILGMLIAAFCGPCAFFSFGEPGSILSGARIDPDNLERLKFTINSAAMPEVAA